MKKTDTDFFKKLEAYGRADRDRILNAVKWAEELSLREQSSQERSSLSGEMTANGSLALSPPVRNQGVAAILTDLNLDADTVIAAILHNSLEETGVSSGEIEERFGHPVALMVESVTRIAGISAKDKTIQEAENIRKMLFAMVNDIRVIFIKLAVVLYNMRTLESFPQKERKRIAQECLDIYAPLADRLGISWMKDELEDLSLKSLNREAFAQIKEIVALKKNNREVFLNTLQETIKKEAAALGIAIEVESRAKHFYSIYQKMRKRNKSAEDLYDLFGLRLLCNSVEHCYTLLGMVHRLWKPMDGRFKDYIVISKSNGYQSLHTTVFVAGDPAGSPAAIVPDGGEIIPGKPFPWSPLAVKYGADQSGGIPLEIQIRTFEMHQVAEYGIASHWLYKKGSTSEIVRPGDVALINRLKDWKLTEPEAGDDRGSESFLEDIKRELLKDSIYVFTPQGKVIELPAGATPIDFAYAIHTAVGEHCSGAKVDGGIIPLSRELKNTQVVEILTAANAHPHINWLLFVKTAKARNKIRSWLQLHDDSVIIEKNVVAKKKEASKEPEPPKESGVPAEPETIQRVLSSPEKDKFRIRVEDEKNMMIRFAKCCNPVMGDPIVGYVSRGRGIIVHRKNCRSIRNIPDFAERRIDTEWENAAALLVKRFRVEARLSSNLFSEIEGAVRKYQGHLIEGRLEETGANHMTGFFTMRLEQPEDLKNVMKNIRGIPAVYSILALTGSENRD
ncbi:MAG: HD domain-containing protein [Treponema sp.]|jgi:GTP pyrophosphokinase|nr:HD domain-containing protein [Treponema sp.]